jgi:hypothetical protein
MHDRPTLENLFPGQARDPADALTVFSGHFATTPEVESETVDVVVPSLSPTNRIGPCFWQPRVVDIAGEATVVLPSRNDRCLVAFDQDGDSWVVMWWPN